MKYRQNGQPARPRPAEQAPAKALKTNDGGKSKKSSEKNNKSNELLKFPGAPTKKVDAISYQDVRVYTDLAQCKWRVKKVGVKTDRGVSWKLDARKAWKKVNEILRGETGQVA